MNQAFFADVTSVRFRNIEHGIEALKFSWACFVITVCYHASLNPAVKDGQLFPSFLRILADPSPAHTRVEDKNDAHARAERSTARIRM